MGASPSHVARRLRPALPLLALVALCVALAARAAGESPAANQSTYMPHVSKPFGPPQLQFTPFAEGFDNLTITDIANAGDERLFVAGRAGKVWIVYPDGSIDPDLFLDATNLVQLGADGNENDFEQGFLGLAFHPDYPATPYFYFAFTSPRAVAVARGTVSDNDPDKANPSSIRMLMSIRKPDASGGPSAVHNAGDVTFGPDGYLYIPLGDGGPDPYDPLGVPGDPYNNSQRRDNLFGAILRVDVDGGGVPQNCGATNLYTIPRDNPWMGDSGCDEIWALGLRNPWRIAIDRLTGDMFIADVGEWQREEINYLPGGAAGGANFGWHCWEGSFDYSQVHPLIANSCKEQRNYTFPVHEYDHSQGECSVIGGLVYRGQRYPRLYGRYFFGDFCSGRLWTMMREGGQWKVESAGDANLPFSTFGEDMHGELYAGIFMSGTLFKVSVR